jgi:hypothetical protein
MKSTCAVAIVLSLVITCFASKSNAQIVSPSLPRLRFAAAERDKKSTNQVAVQTIAKGSRSGVREPSQIAIRSQGEWQKLWRQHTSTSTASGPLPTVDFDKEIVAAVFLGEKPTGGYNVEISSAELTDSLLTIFVKETSPNPGAIVTQGFTQPFHIVRIEAATAETISFRRAP